MHRFATDGLLCNRWAIDGLQELARDNLPANVLVCIKNDLFMSTLKTIQTTLIYKNINYIELYLNTHYCTGYYACYG